MFERYTEKARRSIFFARYEASQAGSSYIESEHLFLGMFRENGRTISQHLRLSLSDLGDLVLTLKERTKKKEPISTSIDLPLSNECKRVLAYAAEEAERLSHKHIGNEHMLLGILREQDCVAAKTLRKVGIPKIEEIRESIATSASEVSPTPATTASSSQLRMKFIDEQTGAEFFSPLPSYGAPRIDESLILPLPDSTAQRYRVSDVTWNFGCIASNTAILDIVEVRIRRES